MDGLDQRSPGVVQRKHKVDLPRLSQAGHPPPARLRRGTESWAATYETFGGNSTSERDRGCRLHFASEVARPSRRRLDPALSALTTGLPARSFDRGRNATFSVPLRDRHIRHAVGDAHTAATESHGIPVVAVGAVADRNAGRGIGPGDLSAGTAVAECLGGVAVGEAAHVAPAVAGDYDAQGTVHGYTGHRIAKITGSNRAGHAQCLVLPNAPPTGAAAVEQALVEQRQVGGGHDAAATGDGGRPGSRAG